MIDNEYSSPVIPKYWHDLYISKESDPTDNRNDVKFCEDNKVSYGAFVQWKQKYRKYIYSQVNKVRKEYVGELRSAAYKELYKKLGKDTNAIKLALQAVGDLVEKSEQRVEHFSQDDVQRRINDLLTKISNKKTTWESSNPVDQEPTENTGPNRVDTGVPQPKPGEDTTLTREVRPPEYLESEPTLPS